MTKLWSAQVLPETSSVNQWQFPSISCVTICMGRLHHLKHTLPKNLQWSSRYPNIEWILLDYNCPDGTGEWVRNTLGDDLKAGRLTYWRTSGPNDFHFSHSRNMGARLASGKVLCLVDADNFTGQDFAFYVARNLRERSALVGCPMEGDQFVPDGDHGTCGRLAVGMKQFLDVRGYDEGMYGWGYEDIDLFLRLQSSGAKCSPIKAAYLDCIQHDDEERYAFTKTKKIGREDPLEEGSSCRKNLERSRHNLQINNLKPNGVEFGCGVVYRNFDPRPIKIGPHRLELVSV
jgi:hypothetical protein